MHVEEEEGGNYRHRRLHGSGDGGLGFTQVMEACVVAGEGHHRAADDNPEGIEEHAPCKKAGVICDGVYEPGRQGAGKHADGQDEGIVHDQHQVFGIHGADRKEYGRHQSQIDALGRHRYAMDVASGDQEEYACYGQHHRQQFTPGRKFSISEGYPENHHGRTGILDHCGSGCISCRNGGKVGIMHEHETHNAIEYKLQKKHRFLSYGLYARLPLPLHHGYQEHDNAC